MDNSRVYELGVRNLDGLVANFRARADGVGERVRAVNEETMHDVLSLTEMLCAKRTGFMASMLKGTLTPNGYGFDAGWSADDFFAAGLDFYPPFVEFGTSRMAAQPALGPAWAEIMPDHKQRMHAAVFGAVAERR
jgi:hypothetical protein